MVIRPLASIVILALLASCSIRSDEEKEGDQRGTYERKNTAPDPADNSQTERKPEHAFVRIALDCVSKQYPNKISHVLNSAEDVQEPAKLTPVFYGCYDWHSSVHGHWLLTRLWGQGLVTDMDSEISDVLNASFTDAKIKGEVLYFNGDDRASFERPYGWAWFLQLTSELREIAGGKGPKAEQAGQWLKTIKPLEDTIVKQLKEFVPKLAYPIRAGTHNQTAFAFGLMLDWARTAGDTETESLIKNKVLDFHRSDKNCPIAYEPSGEDFLSPCLMEADLMRRVLEPEEYSKWLNEFLPAIPKDGSGDWLETVVVNDPTDGKLVHLDGLNISRAWALEGIASGLPAEDPRRPALLASALLHGKTGVKSVATPHYAGSHWLASFATYLQTKRGLKKSQPSAVSPRV